MKITNGRIKLLSVVGLALIPTTSALAGATVVNRTPHDLYVAVGVVRASGPTHALDDSHPGHMEAAGWFKINRFGGSASMPYPLTPNPYAFGSNAGYLKTYIFVEAAGGRKMAKAQEGAKRLPLRRGPGGFSFKWDFPDEQDGPWQNGRLAAEAQRQGMQLETFVPMAVLGSREVVELTMEKLGWEGALSPPGLVPETGPGGGELGQSVPGTPTGPGKPSAAASGAIQVHFKNGTAGRVHFRLNGGKGLQTSLGPGDSRTYTMSVDGTEPPAVSIRQGFGPDLSFVLTSGKFEFRIDEGKVKNFYAP